MKSLFNRLGTKKGNEPKSGSKEEPAKKKKDEGWTIHIKLVVHNQGVTHGMDVQASFEVSLPSGSQATVEDLMKALQGHPQAPREQLTIFDLTPFDESKLGNDTKHYGRHFRAEEPPNWVPTHTNPRPVNCTWNPSKDNPHQLLSEAGLCDGAELAFVKVQAFPG